MPAKLKPGDNVEWNTSQGKTCGKVVKKVTTETRIKGHVVKASASNPEYVVKSDKTGAVAAHKPAGLKKRAAPQAARKSRTASSHSKR